MGRGRSRPVERAAGGPSSRRRGQPGEGQRREQEPEVAQGDVVVVGLQQQVDDDAGQPGGDQVAAEPGRTATTRPATISMTPTASIAWWALPGMRSLISGGEVDARQSTSQSRNLSSPNRIGATVNPMRSSENAWNTGSSSRRLRAGSRARRSAVDGGHGAPPSKGDIVDVRSVDLFRQLDLCFRLRRWEPTDDLDRRIAGIAALDQPLRRTCTGCSPSRRLDVPDEAAEALGVARSVAAFHLDKLADAGVLEVTFERTTGRTGPGAGRPSKLYRPRGDEVSASVPDRRYDLAGSLLAEAVDEADRTGAPVADCARHRPGRRAPARARNAGRRAVSPDGATTAVTPCSTSWPGTATSPRSATTASRPGQLPVPPPGRGAPRARVRHEPRLDRLAARLAPEPGYCCVRMRHKTFSSIC